MLEMMHEAFARHFGTALSAFIRSIAELEIKSVKQASYSEYISGHPQSHGHHGLLLPAFARQLHPGDCPWNYLPDH